MENSSNSSHDSPNHATPPIEPTIVPIRPLKRNAGWTFIKREDHSVIASKNCCIPLPLLPSPKTDLASTLIYLKSPVGKLMEQWQLDSLIEEFSYTSRDINHMIEMENARVGDLIIPEEVKLRAEEKICRSMLYMVQFPAIMSSSAKHVLMEDYKATWIVEYSGTMKVNQGEYLHSILPRGGILASGGNMMHVIEDEEIQRVVASQRAPAMVPEGMMQSNYLMKFLLWNCNGASRGEFRANFLNLVATHSPNVVGITETGISGESAREQCASLGFDMCYVANPIGFGGGLWLMWDSHEVEVDVITVSQNEIHASVRATMECESTCTQVVSNA